MNYTWTNLFLNVDLAWMKTFHFFTSGKEAIAGSDGYFGIHKRIRLPERGIRYRKRLHCEVILLR